MGFYFDEKIGDELMSKINLRDIGLRAKQWDHPVKGLLKYAESVTAHGKNILRIPKKGREQYCVSLFALALKNDSHLDFWIHIPNSDPPDGLVMTLMKEGNGAYMAHMRQVEVVEQRDQPETLFGLIQNKMVKKNYESNTVLVCLLLTPEIYDLQKLAIELVEIKSSIKHVFVIFSGIPMSNNLPSIEEQRSIFTMVQLLPIFQQSTFDILPHLQDFQDRFDLGQESRLIEEKAVYYGTANQKFIQ
jgi:hypothetical protein